LKLKLKISPQRRKDREEKLDGVREQHSFAPLRLCGERFLK
jgi:hypothetical protein